ncbi:MAG: patatin-like phospholipase family protein [Sandaracinaceae bacterium]
MPRTAPPLKRTRFAALASALFISSLATSAAGQLADAGVQDVLPAPEVGPLPESPSLLLRVAFVGPNLAVRHRRGARLIASDLEAMGSPSLRVEVAVGSYDEVTRWVAREEVDIALLPVVAYGALRGNPRIHALAGSEQRVSFGDDAFGRRHYRSVAVARSGHAPDFAAPDAETQWTFVHPLSASGFVVPMVALQEAGVRPDPDEIHFAYSHERARERLGSRGDDTSITFLSGEQWERAQRAQTDLESVPLPSLERVAIPSDVLVTTEGFLTRYAERSGTPIAVSALTETLVQSPLSDRDRAILDDLGLTAWVRPVTADYAAFLDDTVTAAFHRDRLRPADIRLSSVQLAERIDALRRAATEGGAPLPKVALVLSGGGNKCAFEAGVLRELYGAGFSPDVVVGTSGGAFNALAVIAGFAHPDTSDGEPVRGINSPTRLEALWLGLRADDVVPLDCALSAGLVWLVWVLFLATMSGAQRWSLFGRFQVSVDGTILALDEQEDGSGERWQRRRRAARRLSSWGAGAFLLVGLAAGVTLLFEESLPFRWGAIGVMRWGAIAAAVVGVVRLGSVAIAVDGPETPLRQLARWLLSRRLRILRGLLTLATMLGLVVYVTQASELVPTSGVRTFLATQVEDGALDDTPSETGMSHAEAVSHALGTQERMAADLVLTVTPFGGEPLERLPVDSPLIEHEVRQHYMWFPEDPAQLDALTSDPVDALVDDRRLRWFRPLPYRHMVDTAAASGALFPIFGRHIMEIGGREAIFVDGGYAHNIPIEAASLWGATIIVVIRASPLATAVTGEDALDHLAQAFETLYERAQRSDDATEHGTAVFEIGPTESYAILSFHPDDLAASVRDGRVAARGDGIFGASGFAEVSSGRPRLELVRRAGQRTIPATVPRTPSPLDLFQ